MDKLNEVAVRHQQFEKDYENYRKLLNANADNYELPDRINQLLVSDMEGQGFNHAKHIMSMGVDVFALVSSKDLALVHDGIDYYYAYQDHKGAVELANQRKAISADLIHAIESLGTPGNYTQALAMQKLICKINPSFLDASHYEQFQNLYKTSCAKVDYYAGVDTTQRLVNIEQEQAKLVSGQEQYFSLACELKNLSVNIAHKVDGVQSGMVTPAHVNELVKLLEAQGVEASDQLQVLLSQNGVVYAEVKKVVAYLADAQRQKLAAAELQKQAENIQGLSNACHFVGQLARTIQSKELATAAMLAQGSVQIYQATQQIISGAVTGLALLNPASAILMVGLGVVGFFRKQDDPNKIILRQLQNITRMIRVLHRDVLDHFALNREQISHLLTSVTTAFSNLDKFLSACVVRGIDDIQKDLSLLLHMVEIGFRELMLNDLEGLTSYVAKVKDGAIKIESANKDYITEKLCALNDYALKKSSRDIFTGEIYATVLQTNNTQRLVEILKAAQDEHKLPYLIGLLQSYLKNQLKITSLQSKNSRKIEQPNIWALAVHAYLDLWQLAGKKVAFDTESNYLRDIQNQAENLLGFLTILQADAEIYDKLFASIIQCTASVQKEITNIVQRHKQTKITVENSLATQLATVKDGLPREPLIIFSVPEKLQSKEKARKITNNFFSKNKLIPFLQENGITIPAEFLLAEKLGLGRFEYRYDAGDGFSKKHHRHGSYRLKAGCRAGVEISFVCQGQKMVLYAANQSVKDGGDNLENLYKRSILKATTRVYNKQTCHDMLQIIGQHLAANKKQLSLDLLNALTHSSAYQELFKSSYFMHAICACAGMPKAILQRVAAILPTRDYISALEEYERFGQAQVFPMPTFTPMETITALHTELRALVGQAKNAEFRECNFGNSISSEIYGVLLHLNELQLKHSLLQTATPAPRAASSSSPDGNKQSTFSYEQSRDAFFSHDAQRTNGQQPKSAVAQVKR